MVISFRRLPAVPLALLAAAVLAADSPAQELGRRGFQAESSFRVATLVGGTFPGEEIGYGLQGAVRHLWPSGVSLAVGGVYDEPNDLSIGADNPRRHLEEFGGYAELRLQPPGPGLLRPFAGLRAGWRGVRSEIDADADGSGAAGSLVAGVEAWPADRLGLRLNGVVSALRLDGFEGNRSSATSAWSVEAGVTYFFGTSARDGDGDGVADDRDLCPSTPAGLEVGTNGCAPDSDDDGRPDALDACPGTPRGVAVDGRGCAPDGDGDGVADGRDACPDTGAGLPVGADGCVPDADGDGVLDRLDACPETAPGSEVDARGCRPDADRDGVPDAEDRCPGTTHDAEVDAEGCTEVQAGLRRGRFELPGFPFLTEAVQVDETLEEALEQVGRELRRDPELRLEIRVHTDTVGPAGYNKRLSERLARTARGYLFRRFPQLERDRVVATGLGEGTPEGEGEPASRIVFVVRSGQEGGSRR